MGCTTAPASSCSFSRAGSNLATYDPPRRDCLADIGWVPLDLLDDVLAACGPEQLATIEDATREGSGRDLAPLTWPLWRQHLLHTFGGAPTSGPLPPLPEAEEPPAPAPEPGVAPGNYRCVARWQPRVPMPGPTAPLWSSGRFTALFA